jgi:hypothetical protein
MRMVPVTTLAATVLLVSSTAFAQGGRLTGTIKDADGKAIKGAVVRALNEAINTTATSTTDEKGRFAMIGMRSGPWTVTVEAPNYVPMRGQTQISASAAPNLALTMQRDPGPMPGALAKTITEDIAAADALRTSGRLDEAIAAYQGIQAKNSRLSTVGLLLGSLYRDKAQHETDPAARREWLMKSVAAYDGLTKGDMPNTRARIELARTQVLAGNADAAVRLLQDVISGEPNSAAAAEAAAQLQAIPR